MRNTFLALIIAFFLGGCETIEIPETPENDVLGIYKASESLSRVAQEIATKRLYKIRKWMVIPQAVALCGDRESSCFGEGWQEVLNNKKLSRFAQLQRVQELVNRIPYNKEDGNGNVWLLPPDFLAAGSGDCEDYAIVKYAMLRALGWSLQDLYITILEVQLQTGKKIGHSSLLVRLEGTWYVLDILRNYKILKIFFLINEEGGRWSNPVTHALL